jgi:uncharacterized protein YndB with AHSA1/START domain
MYGELEQLDDGRWQLQFTRRLAHPPEKVWRAITEAEHLAQWFPTTIEGDRAAGGELTFSSPGGEWPSFKGEMLAYEPPSAIEFLWGPDVIRMEVAPADGGTLLKLFDTLEERGKAARDGTGWHTCLDALDAHLDGDPAARENLARWKELNAGYVERFGPEAATIGPPEGDDD